MIHSLILSPQRVGSNEWVRATLQDNSLDFTLINKYILMVWIQPNSVSPSSLAQPYRRLPKVNIINAREIEFQIPEVDRGVPFANPMNKIPPDWYRVIFRYRSWEGRGTPDIEVVTSRVTGPPASLTQQIGAFFISIQNNVMLLPASVQSLTLTLRNNISIKAFTLPSGFLKGIFSVLSNILPGVPFPFGQQPKAPIPNPVTVKSVQPYADGERVFPEITNLINSAERWIYLATWAFDETIRFTGSVGQYVSDNIALDLIKNRAMAMLNAGVTPDIKILVWDSPLDPSDFTGSFNKVGQLGVVILKLGTIRGMSDNQFIQYIRGQGCAAERSLLLAFFGEYKKMRRLSGSTDVHFPSGVQVILNDHPKWGIPTFGSHHQKFIVTEKAAYVGGLNFHKQYWDTNAHLYNDPRRDTSSGSGSGGSSGALAGGLHDTGSIIKGEGDMQLVLRMFALRWDNAVSNNGPYQYLYYLLRDQANRFRNNNPTYARRFDYLKRRISKLRPLLFDRQVRQGANYNSKPDSSYIVDDSYIRVSLPAGMPGSTIGGVSEINSSYISNLDRLTGNESFLYVENQYFEDHDITKRVFLNYSKAADQNRENPYYAFIVIPYRPETVWIDFFGAFSRDSIVTAEAKNLKWLEIKSLTRIFIKDPADGLWYPKWDVTQPHKNVWFASSVSGPEDVEENSQFVVRDAEELDQNGDPTGNTVVQQTFSVGEVMTESDIMAYTLVCNEEITGNGAIQPISIQSTGSPQDRLREYLYKYGIYIHSKCTLFLWGEPGNQYWGTIGSANISPRGLDRNGDQDSEMNIFWKKQETVESFCQTLWNEHAGLGDINHLGWVRRGRGNFNNIMSGSGGLDGSVVRLDVWDRMKHLV